MPVFMVLSRFPIPQNLRGMFQQHLNDDLKEELHTSKNQDIKKTCKDYLAIALTNILTSL